MTDDGQLWKLDLGPLFTPPRTQKNAREFTMPEMRLGHRLKYHFEIPAHWLYDMSLTQANVPFLRAPALITRDWSAIYGCRPVHCLARMAAKPLWVSNKQRSGVPVHWIPSIPSESLPPSEKHVLCR